MVHVKNVRQTRHDGILIQTTFTLHFQSFEFPENSEVKSPFVTKLEYPLGRNTYRGCSGDPSRQADSLGCKPACKKHLLFAHLNRSRSIA